MDPVFPIICIAGLCAWVATLCIAWSLAWDRGYEQGWRNARRQSSQGWSWPREPL